jgi:hypothetical protein
MLTNSIWGAAGEARGGNCKLWNFSLPCFPPRTFVIIGIRHCTNALCGTKFFPFIHLPVANISRFCVALTSRNIAIILNRRRSTPFLFHPLLDTLKPNTFIFHFSVSVETENINVKGNLKIKTNEEIRLAAHTFSIFLLLVSVMLRATAGRPVGRS